MGFSSLPKKWFGIRDPSEFVVPVQIRGRSHGQRFELCLALSSILVMILDQDILTLEPWPLITTCILCRIAFRGGSEAATSEVAEDTE